MKKFEVHVTSKILENTYSPFSEQIQRYDLNSIATKLDWKTSEIDGDPKLGAGIKFYFTTYTKTIKEAKEKIEKLVNILKFNAKPVLRSKIELIVLDTVY